MNITTGRLRDLEGKQNQLLRLVELSVILNSTLDLDELLQKITATATELLDCEGSSILLYDEKKTSLYFAAATGSNPAELVQIPVPIEGSLAGTIFRTNQPMILNDVEQDPRHYSLVADKIKFKTRSLLGVPMPIRERTVGVLEAVNKRDGQFTERDAAILSVTAAHAAIAIHNARLLHTTRQALEQARQANEIKNNFLALASHELRTPLGIIIGYATFLQEDAQGELSDHARQVLNAASQMKSLLDQMSNLTLLQAEQLEMRPRKVAIQDILTLACDEIMYSAARQNLELTYAFAESPHYVFVDQDKTIIAFVNLLNNAIRFSPAASRIVVGAVDQGSHVLAWVQDQGKGIPPDKLQKIFEGFYQIEPPNTRSYGGLGIGLTIAKGIIEMQGGRIWAESEGPGTGATFKVTLPKA